MRTIEPSVIYRHAAIDWTRSYSDYPADEWTLQYLFRGDGAGINVDATADGTGYAASITAVQSATMSAGRYKWEAWATEIADPDNVRVIASGFVKVENGFDPASLNAVEIRSSAKQILDALDAAIAGQASVTQMEYEITTPAGSRRVRYMSQKELTDMRSYYAGIVARELAAERVRNGGSFGRRVNIVVRER